MRAANSAQGKGNADVTFADVLSGGVIKEHWHEGAAPVPFLGVGGGSGLRSSPSAYTRVMVASLQLQQSLGADLKERPLR